MRVTEGGEGDRFLRADAVEVLRPSPDRVARRRARSPGRAAAAAATGSTSTWPRQRELKAAVVAEQLHRLGRRRPSTSPCEAVPGDTRRPAAGAPACEFAVDAEGRAGLRRHRSHDVDPVDDCPIAHRARSPPPACSAATWPGADRSSVVVARHRRRGVDVRARRHGKAPTGDVVSRVRHGRAVGRSSAVSARGGSGRCTRAPRTTLRRRRPGAARAGGRGSGRSTCTPVSACSPRALADAVGPGGAVARGRVGPAGGARRAPQPRTTGRQVELRHGRVDRALRRGAPGDHAPTSWCSTRRAPAPAGRGRATSRR